MNETRTDICTRITDRIVADLEQGVRPWHRPWSVEHTAGRITRPLRHNGIPYQGINVVMLWSASVTKGYARPLWLTFKQAHDVGGHVRKGEPASWSSMQTASGAARPTKRAGKPSARSRS